MTNKHPNILLVVIDCGRSDKLVGPNRTSITPAIDKLCAQGVTLPTAITEKSCTTPSFATLLTGLYSPRHGVHLVWGYQLAQNIPMLTCALADAGYNTYAEVSGPLLPEMGLNRGFHQYEYRAPNDYLHTAWGDHFIQRLRTGHYKSPWFMMLHLWELHPFRQITEGFNAPQFGDDDYEKSISSLDAQLTRLFDAAGDDTLIAVTGDHGEKTANETYREGTAVPYARELLGIDKAEGMAPFQIAGWAGPSVLQEMYGQCTPLMSKVKLRDGRNRVDFSKWSRFKDRLRLLRLTPWLWIHDLIALRSPVKLTQVLKRRGLLNEERARKKISRLKQSVGLDTLLDMHMRMWANSYKKNMEEGHMVHVYDFLVKVPLILRWKNHLPAGITHNRMTRQVDIMPTILDLIGIDKDTYADTDGRSFRPLLAGHSYEPPPAYLSVSGLPADLEIRGVRTEDYKYTFGPYNDELPQELYDLRQDPDETNNLADQMPDQCAAMQELANSLLPDKPVETIEPTTISADEQQQVQERLRNLGYID